jgi:hypothetical protein
MSALHRRSATALAAVMAAASLGLAANANAADPISLCPPDTAVAADGSYSFGNQAGSAGCVLLHMAPASGVSLERVIAQPGWSFTIKKNLGGTDRSRIEIQFVNAKSKVDFRWEAGKLVVR